MTDLKEESNDQTRDGEATREQKSLKSSEFSSTPKNKAEALQRIDDLLNEFHPGRKMRRHRTIFPSF